MSDHVERALHEMIDGRDATIKALVEATEGFLSAFDKLKVRLLVAGWNGEDKSDGPYERHPNLLGVTLRTNCGQVYALDEAAEGARAALKGAAK